MVAVRSDKQARAAVHNFNTWYEDRSAQLGGDYYECTLENSPLTAARRRSPHSMLYFLIHVLQRMLHNFWVTATLDTYVMQCAKANGKCPPSIIALVFYFECGKLSLNADVVRPLAKKQRIEESEAARAAAQGLRSAASAEATAASTSALKPPASALSSVDMAHVQVQVARRYAYSRLDQHASQTMASADWRWVTSAGDCHMVAAAFATSQDCNVFQRKCFDVKAVVAEVRVTVEYFTQMNLWPHWVLEPKAGIVKNILDAPASYEDKQNEIWEAVVNLMNLSSVIVCVHHREVFNAHGNAVCVNRRNESSVGRYNFRGNVVERLLSYLMHQRDVEASAETS